MHVWWSLLLVDFIHLIHFRFKPQANNATALNKVCEEEKYKSICGLYKIIAVKVENALQTYLAASSSRVPLSTASRTRGVAM